MYGVLKSKKTSSFLHSVHEWISSETKNYHKLSLTSNVKFSYSAILLRSYKCMAIKSKPSNNDDDNSSIVLSSESENKRS